MIKPAFIFTDHAVLQQGKTVPIFGTCDSDTLFVTFAGNTVEAAIRDGRFEALLPAMQAGTRGELRFVSEKEALTLSDIAVGEVWLAGGQSNMEHPTFCTDYEEGDVCDFPDIRLFTVPRRTCYAGDTYGFHFIEKKAEDTPWQICTKEAAMEFTAIGYFFAASLYRELHVPIGIISCNWGATLAECWTDEEYLAASPLSRRALEHDATLPAKDDEFVMAEHEGYQRAMRDFCAGYNARELVRENGVHHFLRHCGPTNIICSEAASYYRRPAVLRHAMLSRVTPYALRGVIWHQGESNGRADYPDGEAWYTALMQALMADWRAAFRDPALPFYLVQLAAYPLDGAEKTTWAAVKAAQWNLMEKDGHVRTVVSYDLGEADNIHPAKKKQMGQRLAAAALTGEYGVEKAWRSPTPAHCVRQGDEVTLTFRDAGRLSARDGLIPAGIFLTRADGSSFEVSVTLDGPCIRLTLPAGEEVVSVTCGQRNYSVLTIENEHKLPLAPFAIGLK